MVHITGVNSVGSPLYHDSQYRLSSREVSLHVHQSLSDRTFSNDSEPVLGDTIKTKHETLDQIQISRSKNNPIFETNVSSAMSFAFFHQGYSLLKTFQNSYQMNKQIFIGTQLKAPIILVIN